MKQRNNFIARKVAKNTGVSVLADQLRIKEAHICTSLRDSKLAGSAKQWFITNYAAVLGPIKCPKINGKKTTKASRIKRPFLYSIAT